MSKRILPLLTTLFLVLALAAACAGEEATPTTTPAEPTEEAGVEEEPTEEATATIAPTEEPTATAEPTVAAPAPSVSVEDQELTEGTVTISTVTAAEPGWIVIHADDNGAPGAVVGQTAVAMGENEDVVVDIDETAATDTLYAMLHVDAGTAGTYEFPGDDTPVTVDGDVVVQPFAVTGTMGMGAAGEFTVGLELVADGLAAPVVFKPIPDGSGRSVIADQTGQVYVLDAEGNLLDEPFLDLSGRLVEISTDYDERGLLGLAFHPEYADNGRFFVYYSAPLGADAPADWNHTSHISEFQVSATDPNLADSESEEILLQVDQPQGNHDAGQIAFGPDGYLYIPLGDGGGANDVGLGHVADWYEFNEGGNGQNLDDNLLGSILRIDVDEEGTGDRPYGIPADNPFVESEEIAPETWAYGFRNPFRISFDMGGNNDLFIGDAGQNRWEEVSIVEAGGNYGWNVKEGTHCFDAAQPNQALDECPDTDPEGNPLIDPIIEYQNANQEGGTGLVVIGGHVYRGDALSDLQGTYIFGDWSDDFSEPNAKLFAATPAEEGLWQIHDLAVSNTEDGNLNSFLLSFGQDLDGEIYILTSDTPGPAGESGRVYRLVPAEMAGEMMEESGETQEEVMEEGSEAEISIEDFAYAPDQLTVSVGTTVIWTNHQSVAHTITAGTPDSPDPDRFDSGNLNEDDTFSFTFDEAGSFDYHCTIHPSMQGTIVVEE